MARGRTIEDNPGLPWAIPDDEEAGMRQIIPLDREPSCRGYAVEPDEAGRWVVLEGDGVVHWLGPVEARRVGRALLQAAGVIDPPLGDGPDDLEGPGEAERSGPMLVARQRA